MGYQHIVKSKVEFDIWRVSHKIQLAEGSSALMPAPILYAGPANYRAVSGDAQGFLVFYSYW